MRVMLGLGLMLVAGAAVAQEVPVEVAVLKGQQVTIHIQPFLNEEELGMLRLVQTNKQALGLFVTSEGGYAAMAVAPDEGLVRDGGFPASVIAIGDLPDAAAAQAAALAGCEEKRQGGAECVIVLEVGPKG
jgi:hypothetical protein